MHVTDIALNQALGMQLAAEGQDYLLSMPESPLLFNHLGTIHASAQFALAEASSGEFLLRQFGEDQSQVLAVLRTSDVKFRKPAQGALRASARFADDVADSPSVLLTSRGRAFVSVLVEVTNEQGVVTMTGRYDWFLQRQTDVAQ